MKNTCPDYYKKFVCIADSCPDTCCAGWGVVVDGESLEKYRNFKGDYAETLRSRISVDSDGDTVFTPANGKCPFLLDNGLCEMYIELGESSLCKTCRLFPRHIAYFGARVETGLSLSCPEAARIIMESDKPIEFITEETDGFPEPTSIDPNLYFTLLEARKCSINILQNRNFSISKRIAAFLNLCNEISPLVRRKKCGEIREILKKDFFDLPEFTHSHQRAKRAFEKYFADFSLLEVLEPEWKNQLLKVEKVSTLHNIGEFEYEYENLMIYFIFRYFMLAVFDGDLMTKAKFAAVSFLMIYRLQAVNQNEKSERIKVMQKYSKEVEHSALNMEFLEAQIKKSRYYGFDNLINILR